MDFHTAAVLFGVGLAVHLVGVLTALFDAGGVWLVGISLMLAGAYGLSRSYGRWDIFKNTAAACVIAAVGMELTLAVWYGSGGGQQGRAPLERLLSSEALLLAVGWPFSVASVYFDRRVYLALYQASGLEYFKYAAQFARWGALLYAVGTPLYFAGVIFAVVGVSELKPPPGRGPRGSPPGGPPAEHPKRREEVGS